VTVRQSFRPSLDALAELVEFAASAFDKEGIDRRLLTAVDFALEELFTNVVKYGGSGADIAVELRAIPGGVEACLIAEGVADFDPTQAPPKDTSLPIEQRQPGGLGVQLTRQLVDSIEYEYQDTQRRSRVTFRKTLA
jgi:serine/threonine-protein kinase RsbW